MKYYLYIIIWCFAQTIAEGQNNTVFLQTKINGQLRAMFDTLATVSDDTQRQQTNARIVTLVRQLLNDNKSHALSFDSVKYISRMQSPDRMVQVYTWNVPDNDGTFTYYGFVQRWNKKFKKQQLYELTNLTTPVTNVEKQTLSPSRWLGALYYEMIPVKIDKQMYYILLGWQGNDLFTNRKVIEVLYFDNQGAAIFGAPIFERKGKQASRVVFEYAQQASMMLRFDAEVMMIVFDHLAPSSPSLEGNYRFYGPDFSHDGFSFDGSKWMFQENLNMRNTDH